MLLFLLCFGCTPNAFETSAPDPPVDLEETREIQWDVHYDLVANAAKGFYRQNGIFLGPGLPGWASVSGHDRSKLWSRGEMISSQTGKETETQMGSWLSARAGSIRFPMPSKIQNGRIHFWFYTPNRQQAVSVFFNEKNLGTLSLRTGWGRYTLPVGQVESGESRLRLWFRKSFYRGSMRTPGALGQVVLGRNGVKPQSRDWSLGTIGDALPAAEDSEWTFYVLPNKATRVDGQFNVGSAPTEIEVYADSDIGERKILFQAKLDTGEARPFSFDLPINKNSAYRLGFRVKNTSVNDHSWAKLKLLSSKEVNSDLAPKGVEVKRIVFLVLDGMSEPSLRLNRRGLYPATPTLETMTSEGLTHTRVYTGGDDLEQRVGLILKWLAAHTTSKRDRFRRAVFSQSPLAISDDDRQLLDRDVVRVGASTSAILDELERWLQLGGNAPYAVTIVLQADSNASDSQSSTLTLDGNQPKSGKGVDEKIAEGIRATRIDQSLASVVGLLSHQSSLAETLFVVMGYTKANATMIQTAKPAHFFSPLIFWMAEDRLRPNELDRSPRTSLERILNALPASSSAKTLRLHLDTEMAMNTIAVSHESRKLTSIAYGPWLLVLKDAKRYALYHFADEWSSLGQGHPITQRAVRVLVK